MARKWTLRPLYYVRLTVYVAGFQKQDFQHLTFPVSMYIDYVRVYQRDELISESSYSCDPSSRPTASYIKK